MLLWAQMEAARGKRTMYCTLNRSVLFLPNEPPKIVPSGGIGGQSITHISYDEIGNIDTSWLK